MRKILVGMMMAAALVACQESTPVQSEYTGREAAYPLLQASVYHVSGSVMFKEKTDGSTDIVVKLDGTEGSAEHPVHLHLGNTTVADAEISALLNPVVGKEGTSETHLSKLADETTVRYEDLLKMDACVKVHLAASGPDRDIILAAGNIGVARVDVISGRAGVAVCKSE